MSASRSLSLSEKSSKFSPLSSLSSKILFYSLRISYSYFEDMWSYSYLHFYNYDLSRSSSHLAFDPLFSCSLS